MVISTDLRREEFKAKEWALKTSELPSRGISRNSVVK